MNVCVKDLKELLVWMKRENRELVDKSTPAAALCCETVETLLVRCEEDGGRDGEEERGVSRCHARVQAIVGRLFLLLVSAVIVDICWHQGWTGVCVYVRACAHTHGYICITSLYLPCCFMIASSYM